MMTSLRKAWNSSRSIQKQRGKASKVVQLEGVLVHQCDLLCIILVRHIFAERLCVAGFSLVDIVVGLKLIVILLVHIGFRVIKVFIILMLFIVRMVRASIVTFPVSYIYRGYGPSPCAVGRCWFEE